MAEFKAFGDPRGIRLMLGKVYFIVYTLFKLKKSITWTGSHLGKKTKKTQKNNLELEKLHYSPSSPWGHWCMSLAWANRGEKQ